MESITPFFVVLVLIFIGILVAIFTLIRLIILWYYKIDVRVAQGDKVLSECKQLLEEQKKTNTFLKQQIELLSEMVNKSKDVITE